jgi:hypothetical protein
MKVYIAGPYSSDHAAGVRNAIAAGNQVRDMGHTPFIPHLTHFWDLLFPREYEDWIDYDMEWLAECDVLIRLEGSSCGADREVTRAFQHRIPVVQGVTLFAKWLEEREVG